MEQERERLRMEEETTDEIIKRKKEQYLNGELCLLAAQHSDLDHDAQKQKLKLLNDLIGLETEGNCLLYFSGVADKRKTFRDMLKLAHSDKFTINFPSNPTSSELSFPLLKQRLSVSNCN